MGLLDTLMGDTPERQQMFGLLSGGLMMGDGRRGLLNANQYAAGAGDRKRQAEMEALKMEYQRAQLAETLAQADERKQTVLDKKAAMEAEARRRSGLPGLFSGGGMIGGEPVPQEIGGQPFFSLPMGAAPMQQQPGGFNAIKALQDGWKLDDLPKLATMREAGMPEVARTIEGTDAQGRKIIKQFDKLGRPIAGGEVEGYVPPVQVDNGKQISFLTPRPGINVNKVPTFGDDTARRGQDMSYSSAIRGQNMVDARSREANTAGKAPAGYRVSADGRGLEFIPGGPADPARTGEKAPSEGERKAAILLMRLEGSQKQMNDALKDEPGAAKPELIPSMMRGLPFVGGARAEAPANVMTGEVRQRVESAQLDMLDAALTLGTGAAYTKEQLEGYRKSYFPQIGDGPKQVADKKDRLDNVIRAARVAAGRAAPQGASNTGNTGGWEIREKK
jgi:hypothetical protein